MKSLLELQRALLGASGASPRAQLLEMLDDETSDLQVFLNGLGITPLKVAIETFNPQDPKSAPSNVDDNSVKRSTSAERLADQMRAILKSRFDASDIAKQTYLGTANRALADELVERLFDVTQMSSSESAESYLAFATTYAQFLAEQASKTLRTRGDIHPPWTEASAAAMDALTISMQHTATRPAQVTHLYAGLLRLMQAVPELARPFLLVVYAGRTYEEVASLLGMGTTDVQEAVEIAAVEVSLG